MVVQFCKVGLPVYSGADDDKICFNGFDRLTDELEFQSCLTDDDQLAQAFMANPTSNKNNETKPKITMNATKVFCQTSPTNRLIGSMTGFFDPDPVAFVFQVGSS